MEKTFIYIHKITRLIKIHRLFSRETNIYSFTKKLIIKFNLKIYKTTWTPELLGNYHRFASLPTLFPTVSGINMSILKSIHYVSNGRLSGNDYGVA